MAHMAGRLVEAGADGLVLFNRFYQPDIDLDTLTVGPNLVLSTSDELRLVLRWMAILHGRLNASLAATTGVHTSEDVLKLVLAGADITMMASALLKKGPGHIATVLDGVTRWLEERDYVSLDQARGSLSQSSSPDPSAFERSNYMHALTEYSSKR
jgi:dihydroorotate dehydrogenase (fumarate)